jgi:hypothetical protein
LEKERQRVRDANRRGLTNICIHSCPLLSVTHYDNIGHAFLNIFVAVTLEGWVDQMYWLEDSYGAAVPSIFFIMLIIFGGLFALNLALAVISENYR